MYLLLMTFMLSIIFLFLNHPMTMGMILLLQTILIALMTGLLNLNFWFSYILFLIMIGGLLVLFIYMTSIASNEMFFYSNWIFYLMMFFMVILLLLYFLDQYFTILNFKYLENLLMNKNQFKLTLIKYFNYPSMLIIFLMINYLFITLIAIVKITMIEFGPLRQKF